jgi:hypothetical protein
MKAIGVILMCATFFFAGCATSVACFMAGKCKIHKAAAEIGKAIAPGAEK